MSLAEGAALLAVIAGAGAQAVTGIGFSLVCAPVLTVALGGGDGIRLANVLAIGVNLLIVARERRSADLRQAVLLLVPASLAALATAWLIRDANPHVLAVAAGCLVLVTVAVLSSGLAVQRLAGRVGAVLAGAVSGAMNVAGGVGGPAVAGYALNAHWTPAQTRATLGAYFLGINIVSVASSRCAVVVGLVRRRRRCGTAGGLCRGDAAGTPARRDGSSLLDIGARGPGRRSSHRAGAALRTVAAL